MASCNENNWNTVISAVKKKCDDFMCHHTLLQPTPLDIEATNFGVTDEQDHPTNDGQSEKGDRQTDIVYQKRKGVNQECSSPEKFKAQKDATEIYQKYIRDYEKLNNNEDM
jgi:hypothetical protein